MRFGEDLFAEGYYFYHYDVRGSVTNIIKPDGTKTKGYDYDEFGNLEQSGAAGFLNEVTFTGSITDTSTGLQYMNARFYNPATGRFISQDTYTGNPYDPWTQHLYSYCGNNPVNMVDPTGHNAMSLGDWTKEQQEKAYPIGTVIINPVANKNTAKDIYAGFAGSISANYVGIEVSYSSKTRDYYYGRTLGDVVAIFGGIAEIVGGAAAIGGMWGGTALAEPFTGGAATALVPLDIAGTTAMAAVITHGGGMVYAASKNFGSNLDKMQKGIGNPKKVSDKYLQDNGVDPHQLKKDTLGQKSKDISKYNIYKDKQGELWLQKNGTKDFIPTGEYIR